MIADELIDAAERAAIVREWKRQRRSASAAPALRALRASEALDRLLTRWAVEDERDRRRAAVALAANLPPAERRAVAARLGEQRGYVRAVLEVLRTYVR